MELTFLEMKTLLTLILGKPQKFSQTTVPKCPSNVLECWIVLDLSQSLLKPMPITVSSAGLFCSVGTCRAWNQARLQLQSARSPQSHQLLTTATHYTLWKRDQIDSKDMKATFSPLLKPRLSISHIERSQPFPFFRSLCCYPNPLKTAIKYMSVLY